jgi:DNA sulfur modification protein DndD
MRLKKLTLHNFGPFYGTQTVDLSVTEQAPVVVIHGENERGKTTILNAVRWCLYKEAKGRGGFVLPATRLLNYDAIEEGDFTMSVRLEIEHDGDVYQLERHLQADRPPRKDEDFRPNDFLRKGSRVLSESDIGPFVRTVLPKEISRFFLFDGEMLNEYEALLRESSANTRLVRDSIERVLGVPSLERGRFDAELLQREAAQRITRDLEFRKKNERQIADVQQKESNLQAIERDVATLKDQVARFEATRDELRARRESYSEIRSELKEMEAVEAEISVARANAAAAKQQISRLLIDTWWLPVDSQLGALRDRLLSDQQHLRDMTARSSEVAGRLAMLAMSASSTKCALCESVLDQQRIATLQEQVSRLTSDLEAIQKSGDSSRDPYVVLGLLSRFPSTGATRLLAEYEKEYKKAEVHRHELERKKAHLSDRLKSIERVEISATEREYESTVALLAEARKRLDEAEQRRFEAASLLSRAQSLVRKLPDANRSLRVRSELFAALYDTFDGAIEQFRRWVREEVERAASEIHRELSTEPEYGGLKISESFGLQLLTKSGRVIPDRSAGSEQIVALSLIGALNKCTGRDASIVMDTPLGRLDRGHRENTLTYLPNFGAQIILLVQSGEIVRPDDLIPLSGRIARELRIDRDGATARSRIRLILEN